MTSCDQTPKLLSSSWVAFSPLCSVRWGSLIRPCSLSEKESCSRSCWRWRRLGARGEVVCSLVRSRRGQDMLHLWLNPAYLVHIIIGPKPNTCHSRGCGRPRRLLRLLLLLLLEGRTAFFPLVDFMQSTRRLLYGSSTETQQDSEIHSSQDLPRYHRVACVNVFKHQ